MRKPILSLLTALALGMTGVTAHAGDLLDALQAAARNDPTLARALANRNANDELKAISRANFLPQLNGFASVTEGTTDRTIGLVGEIDQPDTDTEFWQIQLRQSIYDHSNLGNYREASALAAQADAEYDAAYQDFLLRVAERYFDVLTAIDGLAFSRAEERAIGRQLEQSEQRFEVGLTAITDVHEARASYDNARARVIVAENTLDDAVEALTEVTGDVITDLDRLQADLSMASPSPADAQAWVEIALDENPTLGRDSLAAEAAEQRLSQARAGHFPTLDLVVTRSNRVDNNFALQDPDTGAVSNIVSLEDDNLRYGLELNVPIFSGGRVSAQRRQAGDNWDAAQSQLEATRRQVVRQVRNAYRGTIASISEVEARRQAYISAQSALEATEAGFEVGTRTIVDVLISQQSLFDAQRNFSQARHAYILNQLRLEQASGTLETADLQEVNALLTPDPGPLLQDNATES